MRSQLLTGPCPCCSVGLVGGEGLRKIKLCSAPAVFQAEQSDEGRDQGGSSSFSSIKVPLRQETDANTQETRDSSCSLSGFCNFDDDYEEDLPPNSSCIQAIDNHPACLTCGDSRRPLDGSRTTGSGSVGSGSRGSGSWGSGPIGSGSGESGVSRFRTSRIWNSRICIWWSLSLRQV